MKSYYETLLGSHGRSLRIHYEKVRIALPGVGLTMTSYPVVNKASLSRKPASQIKRYYGSLYQEVMVA